MLSKSDIDLLTQTGPGTACGDLMRRYWQPAGLSEELPSGGKPVPVRLLGEDLVLFRDEQGRPGLLGLHCPHRGADLSYGRVEDGGLRCIYHGWLFDIQGHCLDQPGEPAGHNARLRIHHRSYPCQERGGLIFAYLGPGEPPGLPPYEAFEVPEAQRFVKKFYQECNYLQAIEGNIDPAHQSFLHKRLAKDSEEDTLGTLGTEASNLTLYREDASPVIEVEETNSGLRIFAMRSSAPSAGKGMNWLKVLTFELPGICFVPGGTGADGYTAHWNVPEDDEHHWKYMLTFRRNAPLDLNKLRREYEAEVGPDYKLRRNEANRYLQDRESMKSAWFSGMGSLFPVHDVWVTNSQGPIQDRTGESLGYTDKAIVAARLVLLKTIRDLQQGKKPPNLMKASKAHRPSAPLVLSQVISKSVDWRTYCQIKDSDGAETARLPSKASH